MTSDPVEAMATGWKVIATAKWNQVKGPKILEKALLIKFKIPALNQEFRTQHW